MSEGRTFPAEPSAVRAVRRFVHSACPALPPPLLVDLGIVASELASNAIQYAHTPFDVRIDPNPQRVLLEVTDRGEGTPSMRPEPPSRVLHGRGLRIVDALADDWGVRPAEPGPGKTVWVRMPGW